MFIIIIVGGVELPYPIKSTYPVKFTYPVNVQELLCDLILGIPYPVKFTYLIKYLIHKSEYILK